MERAGKVGQFRFDDGRRFVNGTCIADDPGVDVRADGGETSSQNRRFVAHDHDQTNGRRTFAFAAVSQARVAARIEGRSHLYTATSSPLATSRQGRGSE